jgi:hypothetical protein
LSFAELEDQIRWIILAPSPPIYAPNAPAQLHRKYRRLAQAFLERAIRCDDAVEAADFAQDVEDFDTEGDAYGS